MFKFQSVKNPLPVLKIQSTFYILNNLFLMSPVHQKQKQLTTITALASFADATSRPSWLKRVPCAHSESISSGSSASSRPSSPASVHGPDLREWPHERSCRCLQAETNRRLNANSNTKTYALCGDASSDELGETTFVGILVLLLQRLHVLSDVLAKDAITMRLSIVLLGL